ncbi:uncharacterized protein LOC143255499 [Tachypleus tridentatus]|uniref:uncharacterized protein LOC143255499 n=1 Tax=Tachypleus tridentatus TaxID=6853 RepID=UPI003FCF51C0
MELVEKFIILLYFCVLAVETQSRKHHWSEEMPDFVVTSEMSDGEHSRRFHLGSVSGQEIGMYLPSTSEGNIPASRQGLVLRQVTNGHLFIQLIYDMGWELRDCEYLRDSESVENFLAKFKSEYVCATQMKSHRFVDCEVSEGRNETLKLVRSQADVPTDLQELLNYRELKEKCRKLHKRIKEAYRQKDQRSHAEFLARARRDIFLFHGTNWCGRGNSARNSRELGYNAAADRCCRDHDHCPNTIEGFSRKYNFFNYRLHTISHCHCDERFRSCLKLAGTGTCNMVGKLFFNIVQTKCFMFKKEDVCVKRSWWGKCLKYEKQQTAYLRDGMSY